MSLIDRIPVPDGWRLNYPHFIGPPKRLRGCCLFVSAVSIIVFIISLWYYHEIDKVQIVEITSFAKTDTDWKCQSIGTYNGQYKFSGPDIIPHNLSINTSIGLVGDVEIMVFPDIIIKTSIDTANIIIYRPDYYNLYGYLDMYLTEVVWGAAPTISQCVDMMKEYACSATSVSTTQMIENVDLYQFTGNTQPTLYNSSYGVVLTFEYKQLDYDGNTFFSAIVSDNDDNNLCDIINYGINNGELYWANSYCESYDNSCFGRLNESFIDVKCELVDDGYCIMNATKQFLFTADDPLPTNTRMSRVRQQEMYYLLLGSELGESCGERWELVCNQYYDIEGYCETVYAPPYSCTKLQNKSLWTVLSLSFASSELIFTILIIIIACLFKMFSNPVDEKRESQDIEMKECGRVTT